MNKSTNNHKFKKTGGFTFTSEPATEKEIADMREDSKKGEWMEIGRSCWECNSGHIHLIDQPNMNCFGCGRYYHKGIDITDYSEVESNERK